MSSDSPRWRNPLRLWLSVLASVTVMSAVQAQSESATTAAAPKLPELTVEQVIDIVLQHNTELLASKRQLEAASSAVRSAKALPNPRLDFSSGDNVLRPGVSGAAPSAGRVEVRGVSQLIENPWLRGARVSAASADLAATDKEVSSVRNALVAEVRLRAFEVLLRIEEEADARETVRLLEQIRDRVRLRVETGEAPRFELIKADAEIITARQRQVSAAIRVEQALLTINRLAAGQLPQRWILVGRLADEMAAPTLDEIQMQSIAKSPDIAVLRAQLERAESNVSLARAGRLPGVELRYAETRDPEIRQSMAGVSVQIPLFDQRQGPVGEAVAERERAKTRLDGAMLEMRQRVLLAWKSYEMARASVEALSIGAIREAEAALRVAEAAYRFGERGILEVLDAQRVLRSVRADLIQARFELQSARISLDKLAGRFADTNTP